MNNIKTQNIEINLIINIYNKYIYIIKCEQYNQVHNQI